jgi:hypothetical protein
MKKSLATIDHACDRCGALAARIEDAAAPGGGYVLRCVRCGVSHGSLPSATVRFIKDAVRVFGAPREPLTIPRAMIEAEIKREDLFPNKYLKASDLAGKPAVVEITGAALEPLKTMDGKTQNKLVLSFQGHSKTLVCNRTNYGAIAGIHGEETNGWRGKQIELYPDRTSMGGKIMDCIRVRSASLADDMDDKIGF